MRVCVCATTTSTYLSTAPSQTSTALDAALGAPLGAFLLPPVKGSLVEGGEHRRVNWKKEGVQKVEEASRQAREQEKRAEKKRADEREAKESEERRGEQRRRDGLVEFYVKLSTLTTNIQ